MEGLLYERFVMWRVCYMNMSWSGIVDKGVVCWVDFSWGFVLELICSGRGLSVGLICSGRGLSWS